MKQGLTDLQYEQLAKEAFTKLMSSIPFVSDIEIIKTGLQRGFGDFRAVVHFTDSKAVQDFYVEVKSNGEKRYANIFCMEAKQHIDDLCYLFMAPYVSESTSEYLRENNLSFLDLSGNCFILTRRMIIHVSGKPNQFIEKREKKNYLSKSSSAASAVIRTMLNDPDKWWKVKELSEVSKKAIGTVSNVKVFLTEKDWIDDHIYQFRLKNFKELLYVWSKDYHKKKSITKEYYSLFSLPELETEISKWSKTHDRNAVLGGFSAAARYVPTVRYNKINVYVAEEGLYEFEKDLALTPVSSGGNIVVTIPHDDTPCMFNQEINDSIVSSPAQTVIDLLGMPNRGEEAAEAIISKYYRR
ncbi:MAG: hypothetical protein IKH41_03295 [Clostridia bacterium]|nr:hypothetical protein [Clostridia bacterium]